MNSQNEIDEFFMRLAIEEAQKAENIDEAPIGAVLVLNQNVVAAGYNQVITLKDPTAHAEILAIRKAGQILNNYRLIDTTLYVTIEPCYMCVGAITHARIKRVVYGAPDLKTGSIDSATKLINNTFMNHKVEITGNVLAKECSSIISNFFSNKRKEKKEYKIQNDTKS